MKKPKYVTELETIYQNFDNLWCARNALILHFAKRNKLAIGGSIGIAISRQKAHKIPGDLDLFTDSYDDAWSFISMLSNYLSKRTGTYGDIKFQNETKFTLKGVKNYFRIIVPFWLPICVMVLDKPVRKFYWKTLAVQYFDDIADAAKTTTEIDNKNERMSFSLDIDWDDDIVFDAESSRRIIAKTVYPSRDPTDLYIT